MPLRGVRNSWLMLARNSLLALLAVSTIFSASCNCWVRSSTLISSSALDFSNLSNALCSWAAMLLNALAKTPNSSFLLMLTVWVKSPAATLVTVLVMAKIGRVIWRDSKYTATSNNPDKSNPIPTIVLASCLAGAKASVCSISANSAKFCFSSQR